MEEKSRTFGAALFFCKMLYFLHMIEPSAFALLLTHSLAGVTIVGMVFVIVGTLYLFYKIITKKWSRFFSFISTFILPIGFFATLFGTFLSLYYSYGLYYVACELCWFQRVFLYPQVFMFALAWWKNDRTILKYSFLLSLIGFAIAVYHHMLQIGYNLYKPCSVLPFAADCAKPSFIEYGFVTMPFMAVVIFGFLLLTVGSTRLLRRYPKNG